MATKSMPVVLIFVLLLFGNWILSNLFVYIPLNLLTSLNSVVFWAIGILSLVFLAWCVGED